MASEPVDVLRLSLCAEGGMPVTDSSFALRVLMDQDGVMRRSDDEFSEITCRGTSAMLTEEKGGVRRWLVLFPRRQGEKLSDVDPSF